MDDEVCNCEMQTIFDIRADGRWGNAAGCANNNNVKIKLRLRESDPMDTNEQLIQKAGKSSKESAIKTDTAHALMDTGQSANTPPRSRRPGRSVSGG